MTKARSGSWEQGRSRRDPGSKAGLDGDPGSKAGLDGDPGSKAGLDGDPGSKAGLDGDPGSKAGLVIDACTSVPQNLAAMSMQVAPTSCRYSLFTSLLMR